MLQVRGLAKSFGAGAPLLDAVDLDIADGEWVAVVGESGSGKSTLLNVIAGLDRPDAGTVTHDGTVLDFTADDALALWRRRHVGFVFQAFHLLPYLDVAANVALPLALLGAPRGEREARARVLLESVGLAGFGDRRPGTLSGGEMQRAAIARALAHEPRAAALMVTHSPGAAARADRVLRLSAGRLAP